MDFSWLKPMGDFFSPDGDCASCERVAEHSFILLTLSGAFIILLAHLYVSETAPVTLGVTKWWGIIFLVIAIGLYARLSLAERTYFWQDEGETAIDAINLYSHGTPLGSFRGLPINYGPVGKETDSAFLKYLHTNPDRNIAHGWFTFVLSGAMLYWGKSTFLMRLPFCLLFVLSAALLCIFSLRVTSSYKVSFLSVLLYSSSPMFTQFESMLRYYSLTVFISILLLVLLTGKSGKLKNVLITICLIISYHIHYPTFLCLFIIYLIVILQDGKGLTDHFLLTTGLLVVQSFLFNYYTGWQLHHYFPVFKQYDLLYLKLFYGLILLSLICIKAGSRSVNAVIKRICINNVIGVVALVIIGLIAIKANMWTKIAFSLALITFFVQNKDRNLAYLIVYSIIIFFVVSYSIKPLIRNALPGVILGYIVVSSLSFALIEAWRKGVPVLKYVAVFLLVIITLNRFGNSFALEPYDNNGYLPELVSELNKETYKNGKVFVEYNHFPLLFYTNLSNVYYIWNINPEFFKRNQEKYFLVLETKANRKQCHYYYKNYPDLRKACDEDPRFYLKYAVNNVVATKFLKSGVTIIECN